MSSLMPMPLPEPALDTIVAISTPPGRGGIGIVRLSGPDALTIAAQLLHLTGPLDDPKAHARARRARVLDPGNDAHTIDDALVTAFLAPHSYTGDTLVEIAAHGSPVILDAILRSALAHGARLALPVRLATPGEFTQRAFLSGRLDLTQAEAVHDLIAAQTLDQARVAAQQLGGAISRRVAPAKESLLHLIALLEAGMDFASGELDDVDIVPPAQIAAAIASVRQARRNGLRVTCEVAPHHFLLTDEHVGLYDTNAKMCPPLRSAADRDALIEALLDGVVDAIATDHAPHAVHEKEVEFERAPNGIIGLETALGLSLRWLHHEWKMPLGRVLNLLSAQPAALLGLKGRGTLAVGSYADVLVFDPKAEWTYHAREGKSKARNTPFDGFAMQGRVRWTISEGRIAYDSAL